MRKIYQALLSLLLMLSILAPGKALAADPVVDVGLYINRINAVSYKEGTFNVDMTLWFRWTNPEIHPDKTFALKGATINLRRDEYSGVVPGTNVHWAGVDLVATVHNKFDVSQFPFDAQTLLLQIEEIEQPSDQIRYQLDSKNISENKKLEINGWKIQGERAFLTENSYETNFGYPMKRSQDQFVSSQLNYEIQIERSSKLSGLKLMIAPIVAILILLVTALLPTTQSARFGVGATVIFALVSSHYLVLTQIPETNHITVAEQIVIFGLIQAVAYFVVTVYAFNAHSMGNDAHYQKLDRFLAGLLGITDIAFAAYILKVIF